MSKSKNQYVTPHPKGGWQVRGENNSRATVRTETKKEAMDIGRQISRNQGSELIWTGKDGRIQGKDSHGRDPFPPRG